MKKTLIIALSAIMVAAVFVGGYVVGKAAESQSAVWIDETGEVYFQK